MKYAILAVLAFCVAGGTASAQQAEQFAGGLATAVEGVGQGVADGMMAGQSVFVTATGRAALPTPLTDAYVIDIEGRSTSAVEAARLRDQRLGATRSLAAKFDVTVEIGSSAFARQDDYRNAASDAAFAARDASAAAAAAAAGSPPPLFIKPAVANAKVAVKMFSARTSVRFRSEDPRRLPPFLDALAAAGVDATFTGQERNGMNIFAGMTQALGFAPVAKIDDAVWDRASQAAVVEARRQAGILASAAGRQVGEARQILLLTRSVQGDTASVTVAVRYALTSGR